MVGLAIHSAGVKLRTRGKIIYLVLLFYPVWWGSGQSAPEPRERAKQRQPAQHPRAAHKIQFISSSLSFVRAAQWCHPPELLVHDLCPVSLLPGKAVFTLRVLSHVLPGSGAAEFFIAHQKLYSRFKR